MNKQIPLILILLLFVFANWKIAANWQVEPSFLNATLVHGDSITYTVTLNNPTKETIIAHLEEVAPLSHPRQEILSLINSTDVNLEYKRTLLAIEKQFTDFNLTELSTYDPTELETALMGKDVLLIPKQKDCPATLFESLGAVITTFTEAGGTVLFTGTSISSGTNDAACIFATGLFEGELLAALERPAFIQLTNLDDPFLEDIDTPYEALPSTYYYDLTNEDLQTLVTYQQHPIVAYRNIGKGKAVLMGHDYIASNEAMQKVLANIIRNARYGADQWLFVDQLTLELPAESSNTIEVTFKADKIYGGTYNQSIIIIPDNPDCETLTFPCQLTVTGEPAILIEEESLDFGEVMLNAKEELTFTIINTGTDSLFINSIQSSHEAFNALENRFALYGQTSKEVTIEFSPESLGDSNGDLTITTNIGTYTINLSGIGIPAPVITFSPTEFDIRVGVGEQASDTLWINNLGGEILDVEIVENNPLNQLRLLVYTGGVDRTTEFPNTLTAIELYEEDFHMDTTSTTIPGKLESQLENHQVFLIPEIENSAFYSVFNDFKEVLERFTDRGGTVVFLGGWQGHVVNNTGLLAGTFENIYSFPPKTIQIEAPTHPIMEGVPDSFPSFNALWAGTFDSPNVEVLATESETELTAVALRPLGKGYAIYIGFDFFSYLEVGGKLLSNALRFAYNNNRADWLTFSSDLNHQIQVNGDSIYVSFDVDASDLLGGRYYTTIRIYTNDPLNPIVDVPIFFDVFGNPLIFLNTYKLDFGEVFVGDSKSLNVEIQNPGTDSLFINNLASHPDFSIFPKKLTVESRLNEWITITFSPTAIEHYEETVSVISNAEDQIIEVEGLGIGAPTLTATPLSFEVTLAAGKDTTTNLRLGNPGAGSLTYRFAEAYDSLQIVSLVPPLKDYTYYGIRQAIFNINKKYNLIEIETKEPAVLEQTLKQVEADILLLPSLRKADIEADLITAFAPIMQTFIEEGGAVVFTGTLCDYCLENTGFFNPERAYQLPFVEAVNVVEPFHPIMEYVKEQYVPVSFTYAWKFNDPDIQHLIVADSDSDWSAVAMRSIGLGHAIYLGYDYGSLDRASSLALYNAFRFGAHQLPYWLSIDPANGKVDVDAEQELTLQFDATNMPAGDYRYTIFLETNDPENKRVPVEVIMHVTSFPQAKFAPEKGISCDGSLTFKDLSLNQPTSWAWNFGDGNTSTEQNPTHTYAEEGEYLVGLEVCNDKGCDDFIYEQAVQVDLDYVYCDTIISPRFFADTTTACNGVIYDSGGEEDYYHNSMQETQVIIAPPLASKIIITFEKFSFDPSSTDYLQIYDGIGTDGFLIGQYSGGLLPNLGDPIESTTGAITILQNSDISRGRLGFRARWNCIAPDDIPIADFYYDIPKKCSGLIAFTDTSEHFPSTYYWDFGDGYTSTAANPVHQYFEGGNYEVELVVCNVLGCDTTQQSLFLEDILTVNIVPPNGVVAGEPTRFEGQASDGEDWSWDFGNGSLVVGIQNPIITYDEEGTYIVTLEVSNEVGCTGIDTVIVVVEPSEDPPIGNIAPEDIKESWEIYPNPIQGGQILIKYSPIEGQTRRKLRMYDVHGRLVKTFILSSDLNKLEIRDLAEGLYWFSLEDYRKRKGVVLIN